MAETGTSIGHYIVAFLVCGMAGSLTFWLGERSAARQLSEVKSVTAQQTIELTETMLRTHGVVTKVDSLSAALASGGTNAKLLEELRSETQRLSREYDDWAAISTRRTPLLATEIRAGELSAKTKASEYSKIVFPYYAYVLETMESHIQALSRTGITVRARELSDLPDPIVVARDPVIDGNAREIVEHTFPTGRRWTVILSTGGANETSLRLPYLWVAIADGGDDSHGPNYFEINTMLTKDQGLVFNILSNFDVVKTIGVTERRPLTEFRESVDTLLRQLLELEIGRSTN